MRVKKELVAPLVVMGLVLLTGFPNITGTGGMTCVPLAEPACQWSDAGGTTLLNGSTLVGPEALLTVNWTGGDHPVINNTLEFQARFVFNQSGSFNESSVEMDSFYYWVFIPAGYYYFECWWNDTGTDLDAFVIPEDAHDDISYSITGPYDMASSNCPETTYATVPQDDVYIIKIQYYSGDPRINYWFYIRSVEPPYRYHESYTSGANQTFNTASIPDDTYRVTASCYDSAGNRYSETRTLTVDNLLPPVLDWVKLNGESVESVNGTEVERGTGQGLTIEWQASDPNTGDEIYANMFYKGPGETVYSLLFNFLTATDHVISWNAGILYKNGYYQFKLEVYDYEMSPAPVGTVEFGLTIVKATTPTTDTSGSESSSSPVNGTPAFTATMILALILLIPVADQRRKKH